MYIFIFSNKTILLIVSEMRKNDFHNNNFKIIGYMLFYRNF